ncbi:carbon-nitrogen hydrolase family protein [Alteromonas sp. BL110]|uniref:carbon-nitrogen hydrolase family protein n=1 Tax=Alteromonas sp. BL110 TaxID=1714845 RepID=UPI000E46FFF0|nr:carbon-nitrogen hydrolase family protein [Alteromonas sp. BL110]AXT38300.1 carbon-nitrogen hydrolase family protein [Alteromonas sp. BL110]RKM83956.1 carbon-nitrogen hydrolase family protein [Alteromonas sp. BL110]
MVNLVALQMTSTPNVEENLDTVASEMAAATIAKDSLVVLPECFACFGGKDKGQLDVAEVKGDGAIQRRLSSLAKQHQCYIVSGTFPVKTEDPEKFSAACMLFGPSGELLADYRKIHMFDVSVNDNTGSYKESATTEAGSEVVTVQTPIGNIGLAVCYDVRFPGLFTAMGDIDILVLPAAFTQRTGEAHWHALLQARAIEKQCYVVAPNQSGVHANGRETYGHSIILSPWGETLAERASETGLVSANVDIAARETIKQNMPVVEHNRFRSHFV